jgi:hypothetical protein
VRLDVVQVTADRARVLGDVREGPHVRLAVGDNGKGMDKIVLERLYDPFFTTKPPGVGTDTQRRDRIIGHRLVRGFRRFTPAGGQDGSAGECGQNFQTACH